MFGSTKRKPADTPFIHGADCKFSNVQPAWSFLPGSGGQWERACRCHREAITVLDEAIDPASSAAEPSWRAAEHSTACEATEVEQVVKIEKREGGSGWRAVCLACTWVTIFFWAPDRTDKAGRPISREANILYRYELKRQPVGSDGERVGAVGWLTTPDPAAARGAAPSRDQRRRGP